MTELPTKDKMLDSSGRPITQSMFLEIGYSEAAIYTFKDNDHFYEGKIYPSLKRLYLEAEDPTEYDFASTYLLGWRHWLRLCENKLIRKQIDEWREELEMKLRSRAVKEMIKSAEKGGVQASKWLADRGWAQRGAGRPSKADIASEKVLMARVDSEYSSDVIRLHTGT
jgi:hypothetical protein